MDGFAKRRKNNDDQINREFTEANEAISVTVKSSNK